MRKFTLLLICIWIGISITGTNAQVYEEKILEYRSDITVNRDVTIDITEKIVFQPSIYEDRHGLEWRLPYIYSFKAFRRPTQLSINKIVYYPLSNENQVIEDRYTRSDENGWANIRIGDPNILINETYVYIIDYTLKYSAISYFDEYEEVYLNIIGPGWNIPIENATATLTLPEDISEVLCYEGYDGSTSQKCNIDIKGNVLDVSPTYILEPYEGYTVVIKQPVNTFENTTKQQVIYILMGNIGILLPIPVGIFLFTFLKKKVRNEKLTIVPQYKPAKNMDPLKAGYILKASNSFKNVSALLIDLAIKGYIKIKDVGKKEYEFINLSKDTSSLPTHTQTILTALFKSGDTVSTKKLTNFSSSVTSSFFYLNKQLKEEGVFDSKRNTLRFVLIIVGTAISSLCFVNFNYFVSNAIMGWGIGLMISFFLLFLFAFKIDLRSKYGNEIYHELLGLKMYINTAEKDRIKFHNDPKKSIKVFESLLPYAMIFGLEKKWAEQFEDIYTESPNWYQGDFNTFNSVYLVNSLSSFNSSVTTNSTPSNYSSSGGFRSGGWSSGGSGFGGGGSSGGGGGGSGGGGW